MNLPRLTIKKPKWKAGVIPESIKYFNHLDQLFNQSFPNRAWAGEITYLKAGGHWYFLCIIIDLFSRKVISHKLSEKADATLVRDVFIKAWQKRKPNSPLIFHSERGTQYTSENFRNLLIDHKVL